MPLLESVFHSYWIAAIFVALLCVLPIYKIVKEFNRGSIVRAVLSVGGMVVWLVYMFSAKSP
jgi:hypothetical protein